MNESQATPASNIREIYWGNDTNVLFAIGGGIFKCHRLDRIPFDIYYIVYLYAMLWWKEVWTVSSSFKCAYNNMCTLHMAWHVCVNKMKNRLLPPHCRRWRCTTDANKTEPLGTCTQEKYSKTKSIYIYISSTMPQHSVWQWWLKTPFSKWIGSTQVSNVRFYVCIFGCHYKIWLQQSIIGGKNEMVYLHNDRKDFQRKFKPPAEWWGLIKGRIKCKTFVSLSLTLFFHCSVCSAPF